MATFVLILQFVLPIAYGWLLAYLGRIFFRSGETSRQMRSIVPAVYATLGMHALYIGLYTVTYHHCLLATIYELYSLIAFTLFAVYVFAELKTSGEASGTGFFVALVAFALQMVSSITMVGESLPKCAAS